MKKILSISLIFASLAFAQKGRPQRSVKITAGGTGDAITATPSPALAAYSDLTATNPPMDVIFDATAANTGAVTINLNGIGAVAVVKLAGGVSTALVANDIRNKQPVILRYNATDNNFKMVSPTGNAAGGTTVWTYSTTFVHRDTGINYSNHTTNGTLSSGGAAPIAYHFIEFPDETAATEIVVVIPLIGFTTSGSVNVKVQGLQTASSTASFGASVACVAIGATYNTITYGTEITTSTAFTANLLAAITLNTVTTGSCTDGSIMYLRLRRPTGDASTAIIYAQGVTVTQ